MNYESILNSTHFFCDSPSSLLEEVLNSRWHLLLQAASLTVSEGLSRMVQNQEQAAMGPPKDHLSQDPPLGEL